SVTYGVVSALNRRMTHRLVGNSIVEYYGNLIETSATINPGCSGGPLFNLDGEVIGVITAIETASGVSEGHGYAIPVDKNIRRILDTLEAGRVVRYGFLGIQVQDVDPPYSTLIADSHAYRGAEVHSITFPDGPAAQAGLKAKDVVIEYDGEPVEDSDHFVRLVGFTPVGTQVSITFLRGGVKRKTIVTPGDRHELLSRADRNE
ncbi:MAG: PDZ domain-containing protein, partial [Phycisphaerae bacterium]